MGFSQVCLKVPFTKQIAILHLLLKEYISRSWELGGVMVSQAYSLLLREGDRLDSRVSYTSLSEKSHWRNV